MCEFLLFSRIARLALAWRSFSSWLPCNLKHIFNASLDLHHKDLPFFINTPPPPSPPPPPPRPPPFLYTRTQQYPIFLRSTDSWNEHLSIYSFISTHAEKLCRVRSRSSIYDNRVFSRPAVLLVVTLETVRQTNRPSVMTRSTPLSDH